MEFFGREKELAVLDAAWGAERSAFLPIYGRRRVGKSELVLHFMAGKPGLYFVGKRAAPDAQLQEFLETASRSLKEPLIAQVKASTWKAAFELVASRVVRKRKFVLALDEFQWMAETSPELPSVLQELWDRNWSRSGRMLLIVCGSYLGFMEREVLGKRSPLFGRRTGQILLRPFDHLGAAQFHPRYSIVDKARVYAICGGIPAYLLSFDGKVSVEQSLMATVLDENSSLAREPEFLLREELRDLVAYHSVLMALAQAKSSPAQLSQATGMDVRHLSYHLNTLVELGYVQRRYPVTEARPTVRSVRYALDDPLLRFWFRFVFPHQSLLRRLGPQRGFAELVKPEIESYFGRCFERLCRECLPLIYAEERVRAPFTTGEYWGDRVQIDIVGVRHDNWTDLGECKWGSTGSIASLVRELDEKVRSYPNPRNATIGRRLFLKTYSPRRTDRSLGVKVHSLKDLYALDSS